MVRALTVVLISLLLAAAGTWLSCGGDDDDDASGDQTDDDSATQDDDSAADDTADDDGRDDDVADDDVDDDATDDDTSVPDGYDFGDVPGLLDICAGERIVCKTGYCFMACKSDGVVVIDVGDIANPALAATIDAGGNAMDVDLDAAGDTLFIAANDAGLGIWDVSDPTDPTETETVDMGFGSPNSVAIVQYFEDVVYCAGNWYFGAYALGKGAAGAYIEFENSVGGAACKGTDCFLITQSGEYGADPGIAVVDVSDPADPVYAEADDYFEVAGSDDSYGNVWIDGDVLYWGAYSSGVHSIDISNPDAPMLFQSKAFATDKFYDVVMAGPRTIEGAGYDNVLIGADGWEGLAVIDGTDPANMAMLNGGAPLVPHDNSGPHGVAVMGNYAYVADNGFGGLIIVKIAD